MKKIQLGNSNLEVSVLGLGCINFGTRTDEKTAFELIDTYIEHGGNLLDTANNYAFWEEGCTGGESERTIGQWLRSSGRRQEIVLATKIGALPKHLESKDFSDMQGLSREAIFHAVEQSLNQLQTDYIDVLYLHVDDYKTSQEETMEALNELVQKGYVKEIGCSNFQTWRVERARQICERNHFKFFSAIQQRYSYLEPSIDADFGPQVVADAGLKDYLTYYKDMTLVAHTPLLHGLYRRGGVINQSEYDTRNNREKLQKLLVQEANPVPFVLKYITKQFGGSVALFTTSSKQHLIENMETLS